MEQTGGLAGLGGISSGSWINDLYRTHFGRDADDEGASFWLNSGLGQDDIAAQFAASPEAQRRDYIQSLYQEMFGRAADSEGLNYWQNSGLNENDIYSAFNASPEARTYAIQDMYRDYLGRDADDEGLSFWASSDLDEYGIANALWDSSEGQQYLAQQQAQYGPYQPWMQPLAPLENGANRNDIQMMYDLLRPHYTDNALAGWFASSAVESYLNPQQLQLNNRGQPIIKADGTPLGEGLFQWGNERLHGIDPGNKSLGLYKFAEQHGLDPRTTEAQIRFKIYEMHANPYYARWRNDINNAATPAAAAQIATQRYMAAGKPHMTRRQQLANQFLPWIQQGAPSDAPFLFDLMRAQMPLDPQSPPPRPDQQWIDQSFQPEGWTPPYQGQMIDPVSGQWIDYGSPSMLQPTLQPSSDFASIYGSQYPTGNGSELAPLGQSTGVFIPNGQPALPLSPLNPFGTGPQFGVPFDPGGSGSMFDQGPPVYVPWPYNGW
jgi:hypothetical protein